MKNAIKELKNYPDTLSKEQFYKICHISKQTAMYLINSGLIPSSNNGKKTRCYSIKKSDVIAYLKDRELYPRAYEPPENWYTGRGSTCKNSHVIRFLPNSTEAKDAAQIYFSRVLTEYPDVMDINMICEATGYNRRTVGVWCRKGRLKTIWKTSKYMIPKSYLIDYLTSDWHNNTRRKSTKHLQAIGRICSMP